MMGRGLFLLSAVVLASGCLCCGGGLDLKGIPGLGEENTSEGGGQEECAAPYIQVGTECCLDDDGNGVCDSEEGTGQGFAGEQGGEETTETTVPEEGQTETTVVSTNGPTTTSSQVSQQYECVRNAGYNPDQVLYLYSKTGRGCGNDANTINAIRTAASREGVEVKYMDITILDESEIMVLECFYGAYSQSNLEYTYCPRLLCPMNGDIKTIHTGPIRSQASGLMKNCK